MSIGLFARLRAYSVGLCLLLLPSLTLAAPFAYISNNRSYNVSVIDTATNTVTATVPVGANPAGVAVNPAGTRVYVTNVTINNVSVIDTATNTVTATVPVGTTPIGVAVNPEGTQVYVANYWGANVSVIDTATNTVTTTVTAGENPVGVAVNPDGTRAYVANSGSANVSVIDTATNTVTATVTVGAAPWGIAVNPAGTRAYVTNVNSHNVSVIDTATNTVTATVTVGAGPGVAVNRAGTRVYVANNDSNDVSVIDTATNTVTATVTVGAAPYGIAVNPAGTRVYVTNATSNNVSVIDTATNTVTASVTVGEGPLGFGLFIGPAGVDLNQHGLTGSWYEPANSGQGILMEIFPDLTLGAGQAFLAWFTYDTLIGGAERQRWYTLQGPVTNGQPSASLTIYENTGGNFNAPPATNSHVVGNATLSFSTCAKGSLSYSFIDGTARVGSIPLTRLLTNTTCSTTSPYPTDADFALSGSWYAGAATSGQGFMVDIAPNSTTLFLGWFTYMPNGTNAGAGGQRWYSALGAFTRGMRTIPVQIYETTGGKFDTPPPAVQHDAVVGTGTMTFQSCSTATFNYTFTGGTSAGSVGTISLSRIGPVPPGCTP